MRTGEAPAFAGSVASDAESNLRKGAPDASDEESLGVGEEGMMYISFLD